MLSQKDNEYSPFIFVLWLQISIFNSMKKLLATICAGAVLGLMASCDDAPGKAKAYNQGINIIPTPVSLTQNEGNFKLNKNTKFIYYSLNT